MKNNQNKYTRFCRDKPCQIRIPGVCNGRPETSVPCHLNGAGMALKALPIHLAIGCSDCHAAVDFRVDHAKPITDIRRTPHYTRAQIERMHLDGVIRTQTMMVEEGVLIL